LRGGAGSTWAGREAVRAIAAALLLDALRFPFERQPLTLALAGAGVMLAAAGLARQSLGFRLGAIAAFVVAIGRVIVVHLRGADSAPGAPAFLNADFATGAAVACALAATSFTWRDARWLALSASALLGVILLAGEGAYWISGRVPDADYGKALVSAAHAAIWTGALVGFSCAWARTRRNALLGFVGCLVPLIAFLFQNLAQRLQVADLPLVVNAPCLASLFVPLGFLGAASLLRRADLALGERSAAGWMSVVFAGLGATLPLAALSVEAYRYFLRNFPQGDSPVSVGSAAVSVTWAVYAGLLLAIGISKRLRPVRLGALLLLAMTSIKVVASDLSELDRLARIASFIGLGVVLMAGAWAYHRFGSRIFGAAGEAKPVES
jgi:uncharacterized membrane protein